MFDRCFLCLFLLSQKSFSLVLDAMDHDNDTSESGEAAVCVFVSLCLLVHRNVKEREAEYIKRLILSNR